MNQSTSSLAMSNILLKNKLQALESEDKGEPWSERRVSSHSQPLGAVTRHQGMAKMNISSFPLCWPFPWLLLHLQGDHLQPALRCHSSAKSLSILPRLLMCLHPGWSRASAVSPRSTPWRCGQASHKGTGKRTSKSTQTSCRLARASCYKPQLTSQESLPLIIFTLSLIVLAV